MSKTIKLKKGLDIRLVGVAEKSVTPLPRSKSYGISPSDFIGVTPKLLVKADDVVKAGSPLFFDKNRPEVIITSPVSGKVAEVRRGDKRKILEVVIEADAAQDHLQMDIKPLTGSTKEDVTSTLLTSGLWTAVIQRPYGIIADPHDTPRAIFVSGFDSAPLAPDMDFVLADRKDDLQKGFDVLKKLTPGKVYLSTKAGSGGVINQIQGVEINNFSGPHPAGNVGVQIANISPVNKGEVVWTLDIQNVAIIGKLFNKGIVDMTRVIAVTGSEVLKPSYISTLPCFPIEQLANVIGIREQKDGGKVRIINGNPLSGRIIPEGTFGGYYGNQITILPEGDKYELLGWAMPRFHKFSVSRTYFSWLRPGKSYSLDTNINGGLRPFVVTGLFERYVPMDIYPMHLLKAIIAEDIDKMENLGIYEIVEEDLALCEFVDPSKNDIQQIVREGINLMIKELS